MDTKLEQKRELVITDCNIVWESNGWTIGTEHFIIGDDSVKVWLSGQGKCILRQGPENEAEYEEFDKEIEYSFEELGVSNDDFYIYSHEDMICEIISLTTKALKNEY